MRSDIITLHMKATKENENIVDRKLLEITKKVRFSSMSQELS